MTGIRIRIRRVAARALGQDHGPRDPRRGPTAAEETRQRRAAPLLIVNGVPGRRRRRAPARTLRLRLGKTSHRVATHVDEELGGRPAARVRDDAPRAAHAGGEEQRPVRRRGELGELEPLRVDVVRREADERGRALGLGARPQRKPDERRFRRFRRFRQFRRRPRLGRSQTGGDERRELVREPGAQFPAGVREALRRAPRRRSAVVRAPAFAAAARRVGNQRDARGVEDAHPPPAVRRARLHDVRAVRARDESVAEPDVPRPNRKRRRRRKRARELIGRQPDAPRLEHHRGALELGEPRLEERTRGVRRAVQGDANARRARGVGELEEVPEEKRRVIVQGEELAEGARVRTREARRRTRVHRVHLAEGLGAQTLRRRVRDGGVHQPQSAHGGGGGGGRSLLFAAADLLRVPLSALFFFSVFAFFVLVVLPEEPLGVVSREFARGRHDPASVREKKRARRERRRVAPLPKRRRATLRQRRREREPIGREPSSPGEGTRTGTFRVRILGPGRVRILREAVRGFEKIHRLERVAHAERVQERAATRELRGDAVKIRREVRGRVLRDVAGRGEPRARPQPPRAVENCRDGVQRRVAVSRARGVGGVGGARQRRVRRGQRAGEGARERGVGGDARVELAELEELRGDHRGGDGAPPEALDEQRRQRQEAGGGGGGKRGSRGSRGRSRSRSRSLLRRSLRSLLRRKNLLRRRSLVPRRRSLRDRLFRRLADSLRDGSLLLARLSVLLARLSVLLALASRGFLPPTPSRRRRLGDLQVEYAHGRRARPRHLRRPDRPRRRERVRAVPSSLEHIAARPRVLPPPRVPPRSGHRVVGRLGERGAPRQVREFPPKGRGPSRRGDVLDRRVLGREPRIAAAALAAGVVRARARSLGERVEVLEERPPPRDGIGARPLRDGPRRRERALRAERRLRAAERLQIGEALARVERRRREVLVRVQERSERNRRVEKIPRAT